MSDTPGEPEMVIMPAKKIVGFRRRINSSPQHTFMLWSAFMPLVRSIKHRADDALLSVQVYDKNTRYREFGPDTEFEKWAAVEVTRFEAIPEEMQTMEIPSGLYAVFLHKGPVSASADTFRFIFETWLPASPYIFDERPQFEVMDHRYKHKAPDSEETFWIPVKQIPIQ